MTAAARWSRRSTQLTVITLVVAAAFVVAAATTELRGALHGGLLALCVFALFPFVIIAAIVALILGLTLLFGVLNFDGGGAHVSDVAGFAETLQYAPRGIRAYYGFLARHRRSVWLGVPAGLLLGTLIVWGLLATFVVPLELRTTELLLELQSEIEAHYARAHDYPSPLEGSHIAGPDGAPARDGFGRLLQYEVRGKWPAKSYQLASYGSDGVASADDFCVNGATKLQKMLDTSAALMDLVERVRSFKTGAPLRDRLGAVRAIRCAHGALEGAAQR